MVTIRTDPPSLPQHYCQNYRFILLSKLPLYEIRKTWFTDYLFSRKQLFNFDTCSSKKKSLLCGIPQGSVLCPWLFLICFNDFHTIKFADDTVLHFSHTDFHVIEKSLNDDMEHVFEFLTENELICQEMKNWSDAFWYLKKAVEVNSELKHLLWWRGNQTNRYKYLGTL